MTPVKCISLLHRSQDFVVGTWYGSFDFACFVQCNVVSWERRLNVVQWMILRAGGRALAGVNEGYWP